MWLCDWCCRWWIDQPGEHTPLMSGQRAPSTYVTDSAVNRSAAGSNSGALSSQNTVRDGLFHAVMKPVKVTTVDKRLQDHANLFNIHLELWNRLNEKEKELQKLFTVENPEFTLRGTFNHLCSTCRKFSSFSVIRLHAYCLEIKYDGHEVPHHIIPALLCFNHANRTVKEIVDKGPSLAQSIRLVLKNSNELSREVRVASLGSNMKTCLENFSENLEILEVILARVEEIEAKTKRIFDEFLTLQSEFQAIGI